ncbi:PPC domain-containing protein, partial [bacterium]|nr:PPC domain-containing protein [bacterium]
EEIQLGELIVGALASEGDSKKYVIKGVDEEEELFVVLEGPEGADFDMYVKFGSPATIDDYDIRGYTGLPDENVVVYPTKKGDYYITVHSYRGSGQYRLRTSL